MKSFSAIFLLLAKQLLAVFSIYFILRIVFLVLHLSEWELSFSQLVSIFFHGLQFDGVCIAYACVAYVVLFCFPFYFIFKNKYPLVLKLTYVIANLPFILLNCIDLAYYSYSKKRITADIFTSTSDITDQLFTYIIDFWWVLLIFILCIYALVKLYNFTIKKVNIDWVSNWKQRLLYFTIILPLLFIMARGSFGYKPLHIFDAADYVNNKNVPLVLNSGFTFIKTIENKPLQELNYFSENELNTIYSPFHKKDTAVSNNKNIVIIVMESFSKEYVGYLNNGKGYTPFLDSLAKYSYICTNAYANGKRSNEGIPAIIAGIPHLMDVNFVVSNYGSNKFEGLGTVLKKQGYATSFFHGGVNGTMNFDSFSALSGFDNYYGKNEYIGDVKDYDGNWGIYDEPFFQFFAHQLGKTKQPFVSVLFSLSSHHPYKIPQKYKGKFNKGTLEIHESIGYADYALQQFFNYASTQSWYNNTLFIITADHTSISKNDFYSNALGQFQIPLLFYAPSDSTLKKTNDNVAQQIDILPSVLDYINYDKNYFAFGNSVFKNDSNHFVVMQYNGYQLVNDNFALQFVNDSKAKFFNYKKDSLLSNNISVSSKKAFEAAEKKLKAFLQSYNYCLINNKMTP